jgi:hypothetical protein
LSRHAVDAATLLVAVSIAAAKAVARKNSGEPYSGTVLLRAFLTGILVVPYVLLFLAALSDKIVAFLEQTNAVLLSAAAFGALIFVIDELRDKDGHSS